MAQIIQIRRGTGSATPSSLAEGELAINVDSGKLYYGQTSTSASSNFQVDTLTANTYIVSSSVTSLITQTMSGSTAFGDSSDDTHNFTGDITASGNISASGTIIGSNLNGTNTGDQNISNLAVTGSNVLFGNITSTGAISASGAGTNIFGGNIMIIKSGSDGDAVLTISADTGNDNETANPYIDLRQDGNPGGIRGSVGITGADNEWPDGTTLSNVSANSMIIGMTGSSGGNNRRLYLVAGNTASLRVDNDGDVFIYENMSLNKGLLAGGHNVANYGIDNADTLTIGGTAREAIFQSLTNTFTNTVTVSSHITASGNISSSGTITALTGSFDKLSGPGPVTGLEVSGYVSASTEVLAKTGSFDVMTKMGTLIPFNYLVTSAHSSELYIPWGGSQSESAYDQWYSLLPMPYGGQVKRVTVGFQNDDPGDLTVRIRKAPYNAPTPDAAGDIVQAETITGAVDDTFYNFESFSASFSKGDVVAVTVQAASGNGTTYVTGMVAIEYDTST